MTERGTRSHLHQKQRFYPLTPFSPPSPPPPVLLLVLCRWNREKRESPGAGLWSSSAISLLPSLWGGLQGGEEGRMLTTFREKEHCSTAERWSHKPAEVDRGSDGQNWVWRGATGQQEQEKLHTKGFTHLCATKVRINTSPSAENG